MQALYRPLARTAVAVAAVALGLSLPALAQQQNRISITTGGTGGVYYPMGGGMANILSKYVPGLSATAEVTGGSVDNLKLINADKFKDGKVNARTLMVLYPNKMHVVTIDGTGISRLSDLKGKRVSTGSAGSGTEIMAFRVLEAVGIDGKKDLKQERLGVAESVNAIKDRKIDAFFWVGGLPTAAVTDLGATPGVKIRLIDHDEAVDAMNKKYGPLYVKGVIPAGTYPGQDKPNAEVDVWNILVASDKMSDAMAYNIVKTLFEKKAELVAVHGEAKNIELKSQALGTPIPFHPGAKKYLEEQGIKVN
jgi:TRAP transporter TAXI family solute receptor